MHICYQEDLVLASNEERQRPFDGLVIDWYVAHGFAIFSIITMVIFNIYAWVVINNYRQVGSKQELNWVRSLLFKNSSNRK